MGVEIFDAWVWCVDRIPPHSVGILEAYLSPCTFGLMCNYFKEISHQIGKWLSPKRTYREKGGQIWSVFGLFLRQLCFKQDEGRRKLETYLTVLTADACCGNQFGQTIAIKIGWWWRIIWGDSANCEMVFFLHQKGMHKYFLVICLWLVFQIPIWWWIFTSRD